MPSMADGRINGLERLKFGQNEGKRIASKADVVSNAPIDLGAYEYQGTLGTDTSYTTAFPACL